MKQVSIFDRISVKQVLKFSEIINECQLAEMEFVRARYEREALNFDETVDFLQRQNLVRVDSGEVRPTYVYAAFLRKLATSGDRMGLLKSFLVNSLFDRNTPFYGYLHEYMSNYRLVNGRYEFTPTAAERLAYSGLRNYLMDLGFLLLESDEAKYLIDEDCIPLYLTQIDVHQITPERLSKWQQGILMIGRQAELRVIEYERQRLAGFADLAQRVEHVAEKNVAAGYDIGSFEGGSEVPESPRQIEVKAVSQWSYRFNWTRNEIETSRIKGKTYFLYLVPVIYKNQFSIEDMAIIRDPYTSIYERESEWLRCCEVVSFHNPNWTGDRKSG